MGTVRFALVTPVLFLLWACGSGAASGSVEGSGSDALTKRSTQYRYRLFDVPGATRTVAFAINDRGQIAGNYDDANGAPHAFVRSADGELTTIDIAGVAGITLRGINNRGVSVGFYSVASSGGPNELVFHGFQRSPEGIITTVDFPGAVDSALLAINDEGEIAGQYDLGDQSVGGSFTLDKGHFASLPDPPGAAPFNVFADGINNAGEVAGAFIGVDGNEHAFLLRRGAYTVFDDAGATVTAFSRLNDHGQVPGVSDVSGAFVLDARTLTISALIACPGEASTFAGGMNNRGQVVGRCGAPSHGFVATPQHGDD